MTSTCAFLDTEFTVLLNSKLLSLGLGTLDGLNEHYVELDLGSDAGKEPVKASGDFVRGVVLGLWGIGPNRTDPTFLAVAASCASHSQIVKIFRCRLDACDQQLVPRTSTGDVE